MKDAPTEDREEKKEETLWKPNKGNANRQEAISGKNENTPIDDQRRK